MKLLDRLFNRSVDPDPKEVMEAAEKGLADGEGPIDLYEVQEVEYGDR